MLAPNAPLRAQLTALARQPPAPRPNAVAPERSPARYLWALLLARIYEFLPLRCTLCGAEMRIIAFVTDAPACHSILTYVGEPTAPPELAPARGPPLWELADEPVAESGETPAPVPEFVFDQRISW